ncbi:MAG: hypothetical protein NZ805_08140 [Armatimonadetes bacterium]|nr:hypothetical protein [Armatimonadota bacterium]MDW8029197.1 uroporphyrinogen decarboxylase family protein [Armatimonadota bacterium]
MTAKEKKNRQFLSDLFCGEFRGHAVICVPPLVSATQMGDYAISKEPIKKWVSWALRNYELMLEWHQVLDDDSVPYVPLTVSKGLFAAAFGCPLQQFEGSLVTVRPIVYSPQEADKLPIPSLDAPPISRFFEMAEIVRQQVGPKVPIGVSEIQSPFDIAALIWNKEHLYEALVENPDSVLRLVEKCHILLKNFLNEFKSRFGEVNFCHYPYAWAPPDAGCWLSENKVGCISAHIFESFCLPFLRDLSETFGGLFVCCHAYADHQYGNFLKIPNLRGFNRDLRATDVQLLIDTFAGRAVLIIAGATEGQIYNLLKMAKPNSRFLFNLSASNLEEAKVLLERIRNSANARDR